jgi:hypothetical protein
MITEQPGSLLGMAHSGCQEPAVAGSNGISEPDSDQVDKGRHLDEATQRVESAKLLRHPARVEQAAVRSPSASKLMRLTLSAPG